MSFETHFGSLKSVDTFHNSLVYFQRAILTWKACRWKRIENELQAPAIGTFDMDIVNAMFKQTALLLPGDYLTLNSHWETNEIPSWWQEIAPSKDPDWQPAPFSTPASGTTSDSPGYNSTEEGKAIEVAKSRAEQEKEHLQQQEIRERGLRFKGALEDVYREVKVLHFTALGKPWTWPVDKVIEKRSDAHPLLAVQFGEWRQAAKDLCPGMRDIAI